MLLNEFYTVERKLNIPLCEYEDLDEGWKTKLGGMALAAAMAFSAMSPDKVQNDHVFVYMDAAGKTHTVAQASEIPKDALMRYVVDVNDKEVAAINKAGKEVPVDLDAKTPEQNPNDIVGDSLYGEKVKRQDAENPWGDILQNHKWLDIVPSGTKTVYQKVRVLDSKDIGNGLTAVRYTTARGVIPYESGPNKGKYSSTKPELTYTVRIFDVDRGVEMNWKRDQVVGYNDSSDTESKATFDAVDKNIKFIKGSEFKISSSPTEPAAGALLDLKTGDSEIDAVNQNTSSSVEAKEKRIQFVDSNLSAWDGSFRPIEKYLKKNLKDPGSYKHIETKFGNYDDHSIVLTKYRARNSFGGITVEEIKVRVDNNLKMTIVK